MVETEENPGVGLEVAPEVDPEADPEDVPEVAPEVGGALAIEIPTIPSWKRTKNLTQFERNAIFYKLLQRVKDGKVEYGAKKEIAQELGISWNAVNRVWTKAKAGESVDLSSGKKNSGRKRKVDTIDKKLADVPLNKWGIIQGVACQINMPKSSVHCYFKRGMGKVHTSSVKPFLSPANMAACIDFCKSYVNLEANWFDDMFDWIHIDEKWFYLTKNCRHYYL